MYKKQKKKKNEGYFINNGKFNKRQLKLADGLGGWVLGGLKQ